MAGVRFCPWGCLLIAICMVGNTASAYPPFTNEVTGLKVPDKVEGDADDWIIVTATTEGKVVRWVSMDPGLKVFPSELLKDSKTIVVSARVPGSYRLLAYTSIADLPTQPAYCTVVVGGTAPPIPPTPNPNPPTPGPSPPPLKTAYILVVEESADATAARGPFITDKDLNGYIRNKGWKFRIVDKDIIDPTTKQTPESLKPWFAKLKDENGKWKLPQILVVDQDGNIRHQGMVPNTPADLLVILKKIGG